MEEKKYVKVEKRGSVVEFILDNPSAKNIFNYQMISELTELLKEYKDDKECRVVILSSSDKDTFSRGYDLVYISKLQEMGFNENFVDVSHLVELYLLVLQYPKLVLGKVRGEVYSPATTLLALCDVVFCVEGSEWYFFEPKLGIIPGAEIVLLSQLYSGKIIRRLFLQGSGWKAEELLQKNIVDFVVKQEELEDKIKEFTNNYLSGETSIATNLIKRMTLDVHYISDSNHAIQLGIKMHTHSRLSTEARLMVAMITDKKTE